MTAGAATRLAARGPQATPTRRSRARLRDNQYVIGAVAVIAVLGLWQLLGALGWINVKYVSTPADTARAGWAMAASGELWSNGKATLKSFSIGFVLAVVVGVPLGLAMGWNRLVRRLAEAPAMALYVTPHLALLPILVVWLGIGTKPAVAVVFLAAVMPILINGMAGIRDVDRTLIRAARSLCAGRLQIFTRILLPAAIPGIVTGVRLGVGRAVLGAIVAEMYVSATGIGHMITAYGLSYRTDYIIFLVMIVGVVGYLITAAVGRVERRLGAWRT